eukprot:maker-scaffold_5-snap-gene-19.4-mRNA-1 protein AED:0.01 eAED:0.01 QI:415/1/1/1/1/1/2/340/334
MANHLKEIVKFLKTKSAAIPDVGIVCGSGLSELSKILEDPTTVDYKDIPNFPQTTVKGHAGALVFGKYAGLNIICLKGRFHSYEGHDMKTVGLPGRLFSLLGCKTMIVTNAAGGINRGFNIGDIMIIEDHIGFPLLAGKTPLLGPNDNDIGPRFPPMSSAYTKELRQLAISTAKALGMEKFVRSGCYCMVSGPAFETGSESAMIGSFGADAVGMSTVPEVTLATHAGMNVLGFSLITNKVILPGDITGTPASHEEVLETGEMRKVDVQNLVKGVLKKLGQENWEKEVLKEDVFQFKVCGENKSIFQELKDLDITRMTPIDALIKLSELKEKYTV